MSDKNGNVPTSRLTPELLCVAYSDGFFPMPDPATGKILWFNPDPRAIIPLDGFHVSRSLARTLRRADFRVSYDEAFGEVMQACGDRGETWITPEFHAAYGRMHELGLAHSVEVWRDKALVGGVYGVALGGAFFAESKFHRATDMSKVALFHLVEKLNLLGFTLLEVQFLTPHLQKLGAVEISADRYHALLRQAIRKKARWK